jgi:putative flippase GtrA
MNLNSATNTVTRWLRFNAVGALGVFVQLATLTLLWSGLQ